MEYITVVEAAEKWGVTVRQVQRLLAANRIPNVKQYGRSQLIPAGAEKPGDQRFENKTSEQSLLSDLTNLVETLTLPIPGDNPDAVFDGLKEGYERLYYEALFAYYRGDFEPAKRLFEKAEGGAEKIGSCLIAIPAAISTGDYPFYIEIETYLKKIIETNTNIYITTGAELALNAAYVSAIVPNMIPGWLKDGDFSTLHPKTRTDAAKQRVIYFQSIKNYEAMLTVAQTALAFCESMLTGTYLRIFCGIACFSLGRVDDAKDYLLDAMKTALPHGFITPFAEMSIYFGGLSERLLEKEYPEYYDVIMTQWERAFANWVTFHNRFAKDNITHILSLREYEIALLVVRGVPYRQIAEQFHMSVGTLKNIMTIIYQTLFISGKNKKRELAQYIL